MDLRSILMRVQEGTLGVEDALRAVPPVADLGFANVDLERQVRCGFPEVVYCEGKTVEHAEAVIRTILAAGQDCLATRVSESQAERLQVAFPLAEQDRLARTFWLPVDTAPRPRLGKVAVVTAGTADLPVAREACNTASALGCEVDLLVDVGVAGIHRLLRNLDRIREANCVVVVAGMEGALPSAVGGLVDAPVVAVPTSVGYGANFQGLAALLGMLNSCAANVTVVNIDAGFKGGYVAALIARQAARGCPDVAGC